MGGGLMQLVAYGAQDIYLTGNPQITFFKVVYRRHTNFSMETINQTINGSASSQGNSTVTISRNGDLVHKMYIQIENLDGSFVKENAGADWIGTATLEIGGQQIDKITGQWMEVWSELTEPNPTGASLNGSAAAYVPQDVGVVVAELLLAYCSPIEDIPTPSSTYCVTKLTGLLMSLPKVLVLTL